MAGVNIPRRPAPGVRLRGWLIELYDYCRTLALTGDGKTCRVTRTESGSTISVIFPETPAGSGSSAPPAAAAGYAGYFTVVDATEPGGGFKIRVIDGANPAAEICGKTDLGDVAAQTLSAGGTSLYLGVAYDSAAKSYSFGFLFSIPSTGVVVELASLDLSARKITQRWTGGSIALGKEYYV